MSRYDPAPLHPPDLPGFARRHPTPDAWAPPATIRRLTVASYNVHRCFGTDRRYDPERIATVIRALRSDVVGLQEVDMRLLADGHPQLDYLARTLHMDAVPGANTHDHSGHFGNALLTRLPASRVRRIDLSIRNFEPRGALDVDLDLDGVAVRVVVTHLGLNAAERRLQVRRLLHALDDGRSGPMVVMGDFNEWQPMGGPLRSLDRRFGATVAPRTFPSRFPLLPLDRIWVSPPWGLQRVAAYAGPMARHASDHLPLCGDVVGRRGTLPNDEAGELAAANV